MSTYLGRPPRVALDFGPHQISLLILLNVLYSHLLLDVPSLALFELHPLFPLLLSIQRLLDDGLPELLVGRALAG